MPSPFARSAPALRANGYSVVPLVPGEKRPCVRGWQRYCREHAGDHLFRQWLRIPGANVGVCLGPASGLVALDFDEDPGGLHGEVLRLAGDSPVRKAGRRGHTGFYRHGGEASRHYASGAAGVLDVLSDGRYAVVPPSVHPAGMTYRWLTERTLEDTRPDDLPVLATGAVRRVEALFGRSRVPQVRREPSETRHAGRLADALGWIPPDVSYPAWRDVGMAIKDECGEAGFALWDGWSARGEKYRGTEDTRRVWDSFRGEGVTLGTLFHHARRWGYRPGGDPRGGSIARQ